MKYFLMATFSLVFLAGANEAYALSPAQMLAASVGVVGPQGEVLLYFKEGDQIVIRNCDPLTVLGATPDEAKSRCQGKTVKVSVDLFKRALRSSISTEPLSHLKPLTEKEVEAYNRSGVSSKNLEEVIAEIDKINSFIKAYGKENAPLVRLDTLTVYLKFNDKNLVDAIQKINKEIEKTIDHIADDKILKIVDAKTNDCNGTDEKPFLYTVLKNLNRNKVPCGLKGDVTERIQDCSQWEGSKKGKRGNYSLVARTVDGVEVYKDKNSGLLWSERLSKRMNHYDAEKACKNGLAEMAGISGSWRLPTKTEFKTAEFLGVRELPNMKDHNLWSSTTYDFSSAPTGPDSAWMLRPDGYVQDYYRRMSESGKNGQAGKIGHLVRCVAK